MIDDREIYECAKILVEKHGEDAEVVAAIKIDAAMDKNDFDECAMWKLVVAAIVDLRRSAANPDDPVN